MARDSLRIRAFTPKLSPREEWVGCAFCPRDKHGHPMGESMPFFTSEDAGFGLNLCGKHLIELIKKELEIVPRDKD